MQEPVKREAGWNPARSRHCDWEVFVKYATGFTGKADKSVDPSVRKPAGYDSTGRNSRSRAIDRTDRK